MADSPSSLRASLGLPTPPSEEPIGTIMGDIDAAIAREGEEDR